MFSKSFVRNFFFDSAALIADFKDSDDWVDAITDERWENEEKSLKTFQLDDIARDAASWSRWNN